MGEKLLLLTRKVRQCDVRFVMELHDFHVASHMYLIDFPFTLFVSFPALKLKPLIVNG